MIKNLPVQWEYHQLCIPCKISFVLVELKTKLNYNKRRRDKAMNTDNKQMMDEEYQRDLGGCAWMLLAIIIAVVAAGIWLFTR